MKVLVETDDELIEKDLSADGRGRVTLGSEYAGETVTVAVVERGSETSTAPEGSVDGE